MRSKTDKLLLAILWTMMCTLLTCFWFHARFGFNIFSSAHWHHLARSQVNQTVHPLFDISLIVIFVVFMFGLHAIIHPHHKRNRTQQKSALSQQQTKQPITPPVQKSIVTQPAPQAAPQPAPAPTSGTYDMPARPPRLNLPTGISNMPAPVATAPVPAPISPAPVPTLSDASNTTNASLSNPELNQIFESAGYVTKPAIRIHGAPISLTAIGTDEVLWIGASGIETRTLQSAIDALNQVFADTLDDIFINVNGFVISAPDAASPGAPDILTFATTSELAEYISAHPNPPLPDDDNGNFDAYSGYISTVIDYLRKL